MRIKINSYIVGIRHPPGTVMTIGTDITEKLAGKLLNMGKEVELVPEDYLDGPQEGASPVRPVMEQQSGPWFSLPENASLPGPEGAVQTDERKLQGSKKNRTRRTVS